MKYVFGLILLTPFNLLANEEVDMSDPMAVYTGGDITAGDKGIGGALQISVSEGQWAVMGKLEASNNFDTYRARIFAPNKNTGTGIYIDAGTDNHVEGVTANYATLGVLQVVPINDKFKLYAGVTYGQSWEKNEIFQDTNVVNVQLYAKYDVTDEFFILAAPDYEYGLDGEEYREFYMELNVGYKVDENNMVIVTGSTDEQTWITYKFKI
ncbi:hypothetical protein [Vibrio lentus]